jgi:hypothetical protein
VFFSSNSATTSTAPTSKIASLKNLKKFYLIFFSDFLMPATSSTTPTSEF